MARQKIRVLYIEDDVGHQHLVRRILEQTDDLLVELVTEVLLSCGLERLGGEAFDVVVLDLGLPDSVYMSPARALKQMLLLVPETPVIVASGNGSRQVQLRMLELGAQDYIVKADLTERLVDAIRFAIVRSRRILELRRAAMHDDLTSLHNLRGFRLMYDHKLHTVKRSDKHLSFICGDVDGLKQINDSEGHQEGNEVLRRVAEILTSNTRPDDIVARVSGDEFWILCCTSSDEERFGMVERLRKAFVHHNSCSDKSYRLAVSFGSARVRRLESFEEALEAADRDMYRDKARAENGSRIPRSAPVASRFRTPGLNVTSDHT